MALSLEIAEELQTELNDEDIRSWDLKEYLIAIRDAWLEIFDAEEEFRMSENTHTKTVTLKPGCVQDFCAQGVSIFRGFASGVGCQCDDVPDDYSALTDKENNLIDLERDMELQGDPCFAATRLPTSGTGEDYSIDRWRLQDGTRCHVRVEPPVPETGGPYRAQILSYEPPYMGDIDSLEDIFIPDEVLYLVRDRAKATLWGKDTHDQYSDTRSKDFYSRFRTGLNTRLISLKIKEDSVPNDSKSLDDVKDKYREGRGVVAAPAAPGVAG